ncbi:NUDIX domain-containing protein [Ramlibacter tataouinensis]|uniref:Bifunctional protein: Nicotinamide-nucleotide adenylyltransferase (NAD(+) pyrophosphorylase)-like protein n=1 Tax=Ramlibacter tataouinensis (strain ATCC BAA-407 / DSM 14655 / LMG 21543 / TTB310) TaxID=365046 RepID=F5Y5J0_RAMTT|nr:NUDIX domain-containing protein [Ramlibacter tataouinensis]AEG92686.1 bifunctional protein : Nicotinamide-nucleotide adenylyltransferase (NAD(+) pyrophosphorylase)-like protein [Ramlibacter tataouinensis TTB310]
MTQAPPRQAHAVCVGAFTLPSAGDVRTVREALAEIGRCRVLIASAHLPRSPRTPFTWQERAAMLRDSLDGAEAARVEFVPLREWFDDARNAQALQQAADAAGVARDAVRRCGPARDESMTPGDPGMRDLHPELFAADDAQAALATLRGRVAPGTAAFLQGWLGMPDHQRLREEWQQIARERALWAAVPYPVTLVTVDAVVRAAGHVLLIRRGRHPGKGLRALPGGFLETRETLAHAAIRELLEETQLDVPEAQLWACLKAVRAFDHPWRSQRNRIIVHAHFFDLPGGTLPRVQGADDAAHAEWVPVADLPGLDGQFLDDHLVILDHLLRGLGLR